MNFWTDLEIAEMILGEISSVASGTPVTEIREIGGTKYTLTVQTLPSGPAGTPFQAITGSFFQILGIVLADASSVSSGVPIQIAQKFGNTWFGYTFSVEAPPVAPLVLGTFVPGT